PIIQNPLGMTMPAARRTDLMRVVEKLDLTVIEDMVYGFLDDEPPLAALAPNRCITLDSLSKKVAPGVALGFLVTPPRLRRIDAAQRQQIAARYLVGREIHANSKAYHLWLTLPPHWRSQTFVAAA